MKKCLFSVMSVAILATAAGCSNEESYNNPKQGEQTAILFSKPVTISHGDMKSKAAIEGLVLPTDGTLGIFAEKTADGSSYIENGILAGYAAAANSTFTGATTTYNWPGIEPLDFYAYFYPESSVGITVTDVTNISYTLQSTWAAQVDLLYTEKVTETKPAAAATGPIVPLAFKHAMARVRFNIKSDSNPGAELKSVKFNDNTVGTFSIKGKEFTTVGTPADITIAGTDVIVKADGTTSDNCIESLVFPTNNDWAKALTIVIDGEEFSTTLSGNMLTAFEAGKKYTYTINYTGKVIEFGEPTVTDWLDGGIADPIIPIQ